LTALLARLRQVARWVLALLIPVGAWFAYRVARRKPALPVDPMQVAVAKSRRMVEEANARAAVQIAAGREQDRARQAWLLDALKETGEDEQIDRLIEVGRKIREGR
jgi:hypothetical protein